MILELGYGIQQNVEMLPSSKIGKYFPEKSCLLGEHNYLEKSYSASENKCILMGKCHSLSHLAA